VILHNTKLQEQQCALSEKQVLNKSLSDAKREIDRLTAQVASNQSILSEKLALERQLNSLEVQIQNEHRAFERARANGTKTEDGVIAKMQTQLTKIQTELATEITRRQKLEKDSQETAAQWENDKKSMKEKLEVLQKELTDTEEILRQTRVNSSNRMEKNEVDGVLPKKSVTFRNTTTTFDPDMTIATPGGVHVTERPKRLSTALGEKSTFSITPYLARSKNLPNSPGNSNQSEDDHLEEFRRTHNGGELEVSAETHAENLDDTVANNLRREQPSKNLVIPSTGPGKGPQTGQLLQKKRKRLNSQRDLSQFEDEDASIKFEPPRVKGGNLFRNVTLAPNGSRRGLGGSGEFSPLKRNKRA